jgi:hypothetical protein
VIPPRPQVLSRSAGNKKCKALVIDRRYQGPRSRPRRPVGSAAPFGHQ